MQKTQEQFSAIARDGVYAENGNEESGFSRFPALEAWNYFPTGGRSINWPLS
jgi:hypothetical protein